MTRSAADRTINGVLAVVAVLTAGSVIMLVIALPAIFSSRNNSDAVRQGNELAACRSEYRADIDDANTALAVANSRLVTLLPEGIAAAMDDPAGLVPVLDAATSARAEVDVALVELRAATDRYRVAVSESRADPEGFLAECGQR